MTVISYPPPGQITRVLIERAKLVNGHPNLEPGANEVPIDLLNLFPADQLENVVVFPGLLDIARLQRAMAHILAVWPIMTSFRMSRKNGDDVEYYYDLSNRTVSLSIQTIEQDYPYASRDVMQADLGPFLEPLHPDFANSNSKVNQITFRLTRLLPNNHSVLAVVIGHQLVDGYSDHRFMTQFSDFYAKDDGGDSLPLKEYPTFYPHIQLPAITGELPEMTKLPENTLKEVLAYYVSVRQNNTLSTYTLSLLEAEALQREARRRTGAALSKSDIIAAWWATVQERRDGHARELVSILMSGIRTCFDHPAFPKSLRTLAANCIHLVKVPCPPLENQDPIERMTEIALGIRRQIEHDRNDPDTVIASTAAFLRGKREQAKNETAPIIALPSMLSFTNSMVAYDWLFDFGFPKEQVAFHTIHPREDASRIYRANCKPGQTLQDRGYELSTYTPNAKPEVLKKQEEIVAEDRERWRSLQEA